MGAVWCGQGLPILNHKGVTWCACTQQVLVSVIMGSEGYDLQAVDCVVLGRITESEIVFVQQMGRGLRKVRSFLHCIHQTTLPLLERE